MSKGVLTRLATPQKMELEFVNRINLPETRLFVSQSSLPNTQRTLPHGELPEKERQVFLGYELESFQ